MKYAQCKPFPLKGTVPRGDRRVQSCTAVICHVPHACWSVFLSNLMSAGQRGKALENTHTRQEG